MMLINLSQAGGCGKVSDTVHLAFKNSSFFFAWSRKNGKVYLIIILSAQVTCTMRNVHQLDLKHYLKQRHLLFKVLTR